MSLQSTSSIHHNHSSDRYKIHPQKKSHPLRHSPLPFEITDKIVVEPVTKTLNRSAEVIKDLHRFRETDDELEFETTFHAGKSIPEGHIFYETDLVVFPDDYALPMPLNGITASDLEQAVDFYQKLVSNQTKIKIEGDADFEQEVTDSIKTLMTRRLGRTLIYRLDENIKDVLKIVMTDDDPEFDMNSKEIFLNPTTLHDVIVRGGLRNEYQAPLCPVFLSLGHEMIHALHYFEDPELMQKNCDTSPTKIRFDDLEEEQTIMGLTQVKLSFEENEDWTSSPISQEEEITENALRSVFGHYLRYDHRGMIEPPDSLDISNPETQLYFTHCCYAGLSKEVSKMLDLGLDPNCADSENRFPIFEAAHGGQIEIIELLCQRGAEPLKIIDGFGLLLHAAKSGEIEVFEYVRNELKAPFYQKAKGDPLPDVLNQIVSELEHLASPMMRHLLEENLIPTETDVLGYFPIHYAIKIGDCDLIKYLLKGITDFHDFMFIADGEGNTLLDVAVKENQAQVVTLLLAFAVNIFHASTSLMENWINSALLEAISIAKITGDFLCLLSFHEWINRKTTWQKKYIEACLATSNLEYLDLVYDIPTNIDLKLCGNPEKPLLEFALLQGNEPLIRYALEKKATLQK